MFESSSRGFGSLLLGLLFGFLVDCFEFGVRVSYGFLVLWYKGVSSVRIVASSRLVLGSKFHLML